MARRLRPHPSHCTANCRKANCLYGIIHTSPTGVFMVSTLYVCSYRNSFPDITTIFHSLSASYIHAYYICTPMQFFCQETQLSPNVSFRFSSHCAFLRVVTELCMGKIIFHDEKMVISVRYTVIYSAWVSPFYSDMTITDWCTTVSRAWASLLFSTTTRRWSTPDVVSPHLGQISPRFYDVPESRVKHSLLRRGRKGLGGQGRNITCDRTCKFPATRSTLLCIAFARGLQGGYIFGTKMNRHGWRHTARTLVFIPRELSQTRGFQHINLFVEYSGSLVLRYLTWYMMIFFRAVSLSTTSWFLGYHTCRFLTA